MWWSRQSHNNTIHQSFSSCIDAQNAHAWWVCHQGSTLSSCMTTEIIIVNFPGTSVDLAAPWLLWRSFHCVVVSQFIMYSINDTVQSETHTLYNISLWRIIISIHIHVVRGESLIITRIENRKIVLVGLKLHY